MSETPTIPMEVWLARYAQRIIDVAKVSESFAGKCATAESFEVLSDGYEDDPEGAADMEMSYWSE
jgi:hypothetical protein